MASIYGAIEQSEKAGLIKLVFAEHKPEIEIAAPISWDGRDDEWKTNAARRLANYMLIRADWQKLPITAERIILRDRPELTGRILAFITNDQEQKVTFA